jgi:hypothetical protein
MHRRPAPRPDRSGSPPPRLRPASSPPRRSPFTCLFPHRVAENLNIGYEYTELQEMVETAKAGDARPRPHACRYRVARACRHTCRYQAPCLDHDIRRRTPPLRPPRARKFHISRRAGAAKSHEEARLTAFRVSAKRRKAEASKLKRERALVPSRKSLSVTKVGPEGSERSAKGARAEDEGRRERNDESRPPQPSPSPSQRLNHPCICRRL